MLLFCCLDAVRGPDAGFPVLEAQPTRLTLINPFAVEGNSDRTQKQSRIVVRFRRRVDEDMAAWYHLGRVSRAND